MERQELPGVWLAMHAHETDSPNAILDLVRLSVVELAEMPLEEGRKAAGQLPVGLFRKIVEEASGALDVGNSPPESDSSRNLLSGSGTPIPLDSAESQAHAAYSSSHWSPVTKAGKAAHNESRPQSKHTPRSS